MLLIGWELKTRHECLITALWTNCRQGQRDRGANVGLPRAEGIYQLSNTGWKKKNLEVAQSYTSCFCRWWITDPIFHQDVSVRCLINGRHCSRGQPRPQWKQSLSLGNPHSLQKGHFNYMCRSYFVLRQRAMFILCSRGGRYDVNMIRPTTVSKTGLVNNALSWNISWIGLKTD